MIRNKYFPLGIIIFSLLGIDGCNKCPRDTGCVATRPTPPTPTIPTLDTADNVTVIGQSVTLQNNETSQADGFSLTFSNAQDLECPDVSIDVTEAYGLIPNSGSFLPSPIESGMPQYTCTKSGSQIILSSAPPLEEGFLPWVDKFNINMGVTVFTVTVETEEPSYIQTLSRGAQNVMNLNEDFAGCGFKGTVLQRVFDCSKKIENWGGTVTDENTGSDATGSESGTYYTKFVNDGSVDPAVYWFVVGCPSGSGGAVPQQSCTWLTPIVPADNPALDSTGPGEYPTFQLNMLTGYQKRLLFSGKLINDGDGYDFAQANGFPITQAQVYDGFDIYNPGLTPTTAQPTPNPASVCNAQSGAPLSSGIFPSSDANIRDILSNESGATIAWQMPSYAMLNILTGGTPTGGSGYCPASGAFNNRPYCNIPSGQSGNFTNMGFNAINIPGFSQSEIYSILELIWSSSNIGDNDNGWAIVALDGGLGGAVFNVFNSSALGVRCVSPVWY